MTEIEMYKKMYAILCGACSDALELLDEGKIIELEGRLTNALSTAEEIYVCANPT